MMHTMTRARGATAAFAVFLLLVYVTAGAAQDCEVLDKYGNPRDCTFTEAFADCVMDATDSWEQCWDSAWEDGDTGWALLKGRVMSAACDLSYAVDVGACGPSSMVGTVFSSLF
jgi:hypothetical protein